MTARQTWDPEQYARDARFVSDLAGPVLELLAPRAGERILDLGCGDGVLTERLARLGCHVVGVDASPAQVGAARARGLDVRVGDGEQLAFCEAFDAVFSNAALHWMRDADTVIDGVWRALVPGGRFVGEFGGHGNVAKIRAALYAALARRGLDAHRHDPWYFPTPDAYRARLEARGFRVDSIALVARPTPLPGDLAAWLEVFARSFLGAVPGRERAAVIEETCAALGPELRDARAGWVVDYVRLRFAARKPGAS